MRLTLILATTALLSACAPGGYNNAGHGGGYGRFVDSDMERGLVGAAIGYGAAKAIDGNGDRGAILGGLAGVFCDDAGVCGPTR